MEYGVWSMEYWVLGIRYVSYLISTIGCFLILGLFVSKLF